MGFKRKFQIGDKVQAIKPNDPRYKQIGKITHYYPPCGCKGVYKVSFENGTSNYYPYELEKVEESNNTNTISNKLSISDLKPGMKIRIRPDLKEGQSTQVYVTCSMKKFAGTVDTIKNIDLTPLSSWYHCVQLVHTPYRWDIDCFSEIVEKPKEEIKTSEKVGLPLKEGQIVTLLDGKKYQVIKNNTKNKTCNLCSLCIRTCGEDRCHVTHINGKTCCTFVIPANHYFKLYEEQKIKDNFSKPLAISDFKVGMRVRIKKDFDKIPVSSNFCILSEMYSLKGKTFFIEHVYEKTIIIEGYHWLPEWLEIVDKSTNSSNSIEESPVKEVGIITKVNFTLTDFKSEKLEHSKFTVL